MFQTNSILKFLGLIIFYLYNCKEIRRSYKNKSVYSSDSEENLIKLCKSVSQKFLPFRHHVEMMCIWHTFVFWIGISTCKWVGGACVVT